MIVARVSSFILLAGSGKVVSMNVISVPFQAIIKSYTDAGATSTTTGPDGSDLYTAAHQSIVPIQCNALSCHLSTLTGCCAV